MTVGIRLDDSIHFFVAPLADGGEIIRKGAEIDFRPCAMQIIHSHSSFQNFSLSLSPPPKVASAPSLRELAKIFDF
jgi:hypothetical protein